MRYLWLLSKLILLHPLSAVTLLGTLFVFVISEEVCSVFFRQTVKRNQRTAKWKILCARWQNTTLFLLLVIHQICSRLAQMAYLECEDGVHMARVSRKSPFFDRQQIIDMMWFCSYAAATWRYVFSVVMCTLHPPSFPFFVCNRQNSLGNGNLPHVHTVSPLSCLFLCSLYSRPTIRSPFIFATSHQLQLHLPL